MKIIDCHADPDKVIEMENQLTNMLDENREDAPYKRQKDKVSAPQKIGVRCLFGLHWMMQPIKTGVYILFLDRTRKQLLKTQVLEKIWMQSLTSILSLKMLNQSQYP